MSSSGDGGSVNLKRVAGVGRRRRILETECLQSNHVNSGTLMYPRDKV